MCSQAGAYGRAATQQQRSSNTQQWHNDLSKFIRRSVNGNRNAKAGNKCLYVPGVKDKTTVLMWLKYHKQ